MSWMRQNLASFSRSYWFARLVWSESLALNLAAMGLVILYGSVCADGMLAEATGVHASVAFGQFN